MSVGFGAIQPRNLPSLILGEIKLNLGLVSNLDLQFMLNEKVAATTKKIFVQIHLIQLHLLLNMEALQAALTP